MSRDETTCSPGYGSQHKRHNPVTCNTECSFSGIPSTLYNAFSRWFRLQKGTVNADKSSSYDCCALMLIVHPFSPYTLK